MIIVRKNSVSEVPLIQSPAASADPAGLTVRLSEARLGARGTIVNVLAESGADSVGVVELQRRLLEFGFVEGARIELIHEGAIGHDPIAVKLDDMRIALRRADAADVLIALDPA